MRIAIDTGGTFTDCVAIQEGRLRVLKLRSTPHNPAEAILEGVDRLADGTPIHLRHGTTVGTNTLLEFKGARVAFVTTAGFEDTIAIGRQARPKLYDLFGPAPVCLVPANRRFGVSERVSAEGEILCPIDQNDLDQLAEQIAASGAESIAISLLFSFLRPESELRVEESLQKLGLPISTSHRILPEFREYERASTIVINAYLMPRLGGYLQALNEQLQTRHPGSLVDVMQSSGGLLSIRQAAREPVRTLLSGPAGGVIGAAGVAARVGLARIVGLDMGGTSTDVFLLDSGHHDVQLTTETQVAGVPVSVPMLDIHTVGAGGGSLARFDDGGMLRVGPESAGADPGPICFGKGTQPTTTDANLILGRIAETRFAGGDLTLDADRTRRRFGETKSSLANVEEFAAGILRVVEAQMAGAIRVVSVERGHDPRDFTLIAYGGGGPLHACALARLLQMRQVLVPSLPGALSAMGILLADEVRDLSRTVMLPAESLSELDSSFSALEQALEVDTSSTVGAEFERSVDLRYHGQGYELNVPHHDNAVESFHQKHQERYGFADRDRPIEIVNLRVRRRIPCEGIALEECEERPGDGAQALTAERKVYFDGHWLATCVYDRDLLEPGDRIHGPALIVEYTSTTVLDPGSSLKVDSHRNLRIDVGAAGGA